MSANRVGKIRVSTELIMDAIGMPEGTRAIDARYVAAWQYLEFVIESPALPPLRSECEVPLRSECEVPLYRVDMDSEKNVMFHM